MTFYHLREIFITVIQEAEKSVAGLKERLKVKEAELVDATARLQETSHALQSQAADQSTVRERQAEDKELLYQNMMRDRDEQINTLNELLVSWL